jgi:N-acetylglutamate synthase-like GNAT family acetyltransferase
VGELENMLVDRLIAAHWRLRRISRVEASIFAWEHYRELAKRTREDARGLGLGRIFTEASVTARPFFERHGFRVLREQTVSRRGARARGRDSFERPRPFC